jgi:hypothetical protein
MTFSYINRLTSWRTIFNRQTLEKKTDGSEIRPYHLWNDNSERFFNLTLPAAPVLPA